MFVLSLLVHTAYLFHHYNIFIISKVALVFSSSGVFKSAHPEVRLECLSRRRSNQDGGAHRWKKSVSNFYQEDRTRWRRRRWKQLMTEVTVFAVMASDLSLLTFNDL